MQLLQESLDDTSARSVDGARSALGACPEPLLDRPEPETVAGGDPPAEGRGHRP
jgi:ATP-dependent DNA helicase RecQ